MALTDCTSSVANSRIKNLTNEDNFGHYFYDNVLYYFDENPNGVYMNFVAMSKKYYDETNNKTNTEITSEENIQINDDIKNAISSVNSEFGLDFEPTAEQLKEIQEFYDINNPTGDFHNDTLLQFLVQKGWVDMGENNSSNSNNSTNSSSSSNKSSSTNEKTNTSTENKIQPYINVLVYPLTYFSDEERERVCQNNESVKITIKYNGKTIKSSTYKYSDNKDGIVELNNLKVDTNEGKLTVEINDKVVPDSNGNTNVDVSIYQLDNELKDNMFTFVNTSNMMG